LRITLYLGLLSVFAATGWKAGGNDSERSSYAGSFALYALPFSYLELALIGKWEQEPGSKEEYGCCLQSCRAFLMTVYLSIDSVFLPLILTESYSDRPIDPTVAMLTAFATNILMLLIYQKIRDRLVTTKKTSATLLTEEGEPRSISEPERGECEPVEIEMTTLSTTTEARTYVTLPGEGLDDDSPRLTEIVCGH